MEGVLIRDNSWGFLFPFFIIKIDSTFNSNFFFSFWKERVSDRWKLIVDCGLDVDPISQIGLVVWSTRLYWTWVCMGYFVGRFRARDNFAGVRINNYCWYTKPGIAPGLSKKNSNLDLLSRILVLYLYFLYYIILYLNYCINFDIFIYIIFYIILMFIIILCAI